MNRIKNFAIAMIVTTTCAVALANKEDRTAQRHVLKPLAEIMSKIAITKHHFLSQDASTAKREMEQRSTALETRIALLQSDLEKIEETIKNASIQEKFQTLLNAYTDQYYNLYNLSIEKKINSQRR